MGPATPLVQQFVLMVTLIVKSVDQSIQSLDTAVTFCLYGYHYCDPSNIFKLTAKWKGGGYLTWLRREKIYLLFLVNLIRL